MLLIFKKKDLNLNLSISLMVNFTTNLNIKQMKHKCNKKTVDTKLQTWSRDMLKFIIKKKASWIKIWVRIL
jgi:hypothetical protein